MFRGGTPAIGREGNAFFVRPIGMAFKMPALINFEKTIFPGSLSDGECTII